MKITFLAPHIRVAGGVRAILTYADRLAGRGHDVTVVVPARRPWLAGWRNFRRQGPDWIPGFRARVRWVAAWNPAGLPSADALIATAWQSADAVARAPAHAGAKFYFVQHYESLYHGQPARVDATYPLPLRKIVMMKTGSSSSHLAAHADCATSFHENVTSSRSTRRPMKMP